MVRFHKRGSAMPSFQPPIRTRARSPRLSCVNSEFCVLSSEFSALGPKKDSKWTRKGLAFSPGTSRASPQPLAPPQVAREDSKTTPHAHFFFVQLASLRSRRHDRHVLGSRASECNTLQHFSILIAWSLGFGHSLVIAALDIGHCKFPPFAQRPRDLLTTDNGPRTTDHGQRTTYKSNPPIQMKKTPGASQS